MKLVKPPSTLLIGDPGTGKTYSLVTYLKRPQIKRLIVYGTESGFVDSLLEAAEDLNVPIDKIHWHAIEEDGEKSMQQLLKMAADIGSKDYEALSGMKASAMLKKDTLFFWKMMKDLEDFPCDRTNTTLGNLYRWGPDTAFAIDSLSGLNDYARLQTVGYKPTMAQGEWGVAMNLQLMFIKRMKTDLRCFFTLTAHPDKELNEITGVKQITSGALGQKNAGKIGQDFGEIVYCKRGTTKKDFKWSTIEPNTALKSRGLPMSANIEPDFSQIVDVHLARLRKAGQEQAAYPSSAPISAT